MCRIFGFCGDSSPRTTALLRALILTEERSNPHGTGIVIRNRSSKDTLAKKGIRGRDFLIRGHADFLWSRQYMYALGHVRYKTVGEQSDENSHPFGFEVNGKWFWGIHNGTIGRPQELVDKYRYKPCKVDSATFFKALAHLERRGKHTPAAIEELTEFISEKADFAFAYLTQECLWLWRSPDRPLCIFDAREVGLGRWFASTKEMFSEAWRMAGIEEDLSKVTYFEAKPYRLYYVKADGTFEMESLKDLRHKSRERPRQVLWEEYRHYPTKKPAQKSKRRESPLLDGLGTFDSLEAVIGNEDEGMEMNIREFSDSDLVLKITKVESEIQALKEENSHLTTEWQSWLSELEAELERRKRIRKNEHSGRTGRLYNGRENYIRHFGR